MQKSNEAKVPEPTPQEWEVEMRSAITIRKGQELRFTPPIGARVGEPNPFQAVAKYYNDQCCKVVGVEVDDHRTRVIVKFEDGAEHPILQDYLFAPATKSTSAQ